MTSEFFIDLGGGNEVTDSSSKSSTSSLSWSLLALGEHVLEMVASTSSSTSRSEIKYKYMNYVKVEDLRDE